MTQKQYDQLKEDHKHRVRFVWSHWINISMDYGKALDFIKEDTKEFLSQVPPTNEDDRINI